MSLVFGKLRKPVVLQTFLPCLFIILHFWSTRYFRGPHVFRLCILSNGLSSVGLFHLAFLQATCSSSNNGWMVRLKNSRILTIANGEKR